ncbi:Uncharacterised protein [Vibrio cholerae]|nr:Uncharacterised protein [Vibrio cholerae]CSI28724.1 Uncharacterised protein [Vibrio cholerae]
MTSEVILFLNSPCYLLCMDYTNHIQQVDESE